VNIKKIIDLLYNICLIIFNLRARGFEFEERITDPDKRKDERMTGLRKLTEAEITLYLMQQIDDPFGIGENSICWIAECGLNKMTKERARELLVSDMTEH